MCLLLQLFDTNRLYVYRLCLTGGPCAGKTSSLDHLTKALTARGFDVYCCPEVPTILLNGGCRCVLEVGRGQGASVGL